MKSLEGRAREGRRLIVVGVIVNIALAIAKIAGGIFGRSHALIADGIESSLDVFSSAMMWVAIKYAERPPDGDHPYGHGKMESLAAMAGSVVLMGAGLALGIHSVREILLLSASATSQDIPEWFTLAILAGTIIVKEILFRVLHKRGIELESKAVQTDAWHHRSDAMTSLAAVIGITAALVGGPQWAQADDWAALFSCGLIVFNGLNMFRSSLGDVLDEQASTEVTSRIQILVQSVPEVSSVEKCRVRKSGLMRLADLHVRVAGTMTVREGHEIAHIVKDRLMASDLHLSDVTVHIEPEANS